MQSEWTLQLFPSTPLVFILQSPVWYALQMAKPRRGEVCRPSLTTLQFSRACLSYTRNGRERVSSSSPPLTAPSSGPTTKSVDVGLRRARGWELDSSPNTLLRDSMCMCTNTTCVSNPSFQKLSDPSAVRWPAVQELKFFGAHFELSLVQQRPARRTIRAVELPCMSAEAPERFLRRHHHPPCKPDEVSYQGQYGNQK